jgi:hypothetical protein
MQVTVVGEVDMVAVFHFFMAAFLAVLVRVVGVLAGALFRVAGIRLSGHPDHERKAGKTNH